MSLDTDLSDLQGPDFETRDAATIEAERLVVDIDGFEGPLDMLLSLARLQKVDLRRISVLQLAEQYLAFVAEARRLRIELAADYLVMAAWLAWLKSRLLLPPPEPEDGEPDGEELAARLAFQLERLDAMRRVAAQLMARDRLGRDIFARGQTEHLTTERRTVWTASLGDLLAAYARVRTRAEYRPLQVDRPAVFPVARALERLRAALGAAPDWYELEGFLPADWRESPERRRSAVASGFAAALEMAKRGEIELRQEGTFAPIFLRAREGLNAPDAEADGQESALPEEVPADG